MIDVAPKLEPLTGDAAWTLVSLGPTQAAADTTATTVSNTVVETTLASMSIDAASVTAGALIEARFGAAIINVTGTPTCTIRIKVEGTTLLFSSFSGGVGATPDQMVFSLSLVRVGSNLQVVAADGLGGPAITGPTLTTFSSIAITGNTDLTMTAQWDAASASNVVTNRGAVAYIVSA